jgi:septum formation protein
MRVLRDAGFGADVVVSGVDERVDAPDTTTAVTVLAQRKGMAVASGCPEALVIACDSMLDLHGQALGKPTSAVEAIEYWRRLAGQEGVLCTGHWVKDT